MVRIALVGDCHVTQSKNKEFEANRFKLLCNTISTKKYDMVIFMGDLFDRARPSLEEIQIIQNSVMKLNRIGIRTIVFDGNHEAVTKDSSTYDYLRIEGLEYMPYDLLEIENVKVHTMGYKNLSNYILLPKCDILLSHFRSSFGIIKEEVNTSSIAKKATTVFLGDIHQRYSPLENVHYTGSPYGVHFSKENHKYGYIELIIDNGKYTYHYVDLNLPTKRILDMSIKASNCITNTEDLLRIRVQGTSEELEKLKQYSNVNYITSLVLKEQSISVDLRTDILDTLILNIGESPEVRRVLSKIYKEIT